MLGKLILALKSKAVLAALGALLVAGGGTTVALAATGAGAPLIAQAHHDGNDGQHDGSRGTSHDADQDDDNNEHELRGSVASVNAADSTFALRLAGGATRTVAVSANTTFDGGLTAFGDLKSGMSVEVEGNVRADGTLDATRVHREDDAAGAAGDDHGGANGNRGPGGGADDHGGTGNGGSGRGGSDDPAGHH